MFHHGTIRKYTAAILDLFNDLEIQYTDSNGNVRARNIPVKYSSIEKYKELDKFTSEQLLSGNTNVLPRAAVALSTLIKAEQRIQNKNLKINKVKQENSFEYMYNSVPYEFTYELAVMCRGMNEAAMIIEQIAPKFNPTINVDVWDAENLDEPTRVPVKLLDIGIENNEYDELSSNLVTVSFGLSIMGNLYPPVRSIERIKQFKMLMAEHVGTEYKRTTILNFDVNPDGSLNTGLDIHLDQPNTYAPNIVDIIGMNIVMGTNNLEVIYSDYDNKTGELTFEWDVISGNATITGNNEFATLTITDFGTVEVMCTIKDVYNNFVSRSKSFAIISYDQTADSTVITTDSNIITADKT